MLVHAFLQRPDSQRLTSVQPCIHFGVEIVVRFTNSAHHLRTLLVSWHGMLWEVVSQVFGGGSNLSNNPQSEVSHMVVDLIERLCVW